MACNTSLTSIPKACQLNIGGLKRVWLMPTEFQTGSTLSNGTVTGLTYTSGATWAEIEFNKNTTFYTVEQQTSLENGSTFYNQTLTVVIPYRQVSSRNSLALMAQGQRNLKAIVQDQNDKYWYLGYANSLNLTQNTDGSGTAKADGSKYTVTFFGEEPQLEYEVAANLITGPAFVL